MNVCPVMARGDMRKRSHLFEALLSTQRLTRAQKSISVRRISSGIGMSSISSKLLSFLCIICSMSSIHALLTGSTRIVGIQSRSARTSSVLNRGLLPSRSSKLFSTIDEALKTALQKPHPYRNITPVILEKVGKYLHRNDKHPLGIIKGKIEEYCNIYTKEKGQTPFAIFDNLSPLVNTKNCFDDLRVGPDHPSRRQSDTYYVTGAPKSSLEMM